MEKYLITFHGQNYCTHAENLLEAEMKFIYEYDISPEEEDEMRISTIGEMKDDSDVIYF